MSGKRLGVGIVGLEPGRSWAARAHVPALQALSDKFEIIGVANSTPESAERAASALGLPKAFASVTALTGDPSVDIVTVAVRVPRHLELVTAAIAAGKHVYCEWPLGNGLEEAKKLADLAREKGVLGVVGTQARTSPEIVHLKRLVSEGVVGDVLSSTLVAYGGGWGGVIADKRTQAYLQDIRNGATMLTIPVGHSLAAVQEVLGELTAVRSLLATRRPEAVVMGSDEKIPVTAADQVLVSGLLAGGAPMSLHFRGGMPRDGQGFFWEINGTQGDIRVTGPLGHSQMVPLALSVARGEEKAFHPVEIPDSDEISWPKDVIPGNVARIYARMAADLTDGTRTAPDFDDAVALHRLIDTIERAASTPLTTVGV